MKYKHALHPPDYAAGPNEVFYENMAQKGWILEQRGRFFSKFRQEEPQTLRYRVEYASDSSGLATAYLPPEQLQLYRDCGWELVAFHGLVYLFRASEHCAVPELHTDPRTQAETLDAIDRAARRGTVALLLLLVWRVAYRVLRYSHTLLPLALALILLPLFAIVLQLVRYTGFRRLHRRLAAGIPPDRSGKRWYLVWRFVSWAMAAALIVLVCLAYYTAFQMF